MFLGFIQRGRKARLADAAANAQMLLVSEGTFMWVNDGTGHVSTGLATLFPACALTGDPSSRLALHFRGRRR